MNRNFFRSLLLIAGMSPNLVVWADDFRPPYYEDFLKQPAAYAKNAEFRAYIRGVIDTIRIGHLCTDDAFRNVESALNALVAYGKTGIGQEQAMTEGKLFPSTAGSALLTVADRKGCAVKPR